MTRTRTSIAAALLLSAAAVPLFAGGPAAAAPGVLPWDFNDDGKADLAIGAPGENVGSLVDAGSVSVFMADPITGAFDSQSVVWTQNSLDVAGTAESDDQFGWAMTSGDFNGDGVADLASSANREDIGSGTDKKVNAGLVIVLFGVAGSGLTGTGSVALEFNPYDVVRANTYAGDALASGDMNGDGIDELAVGGPGRESVRVYNGSATFGTSPSWTTFTEDSPGVDGTKHLGTSTAGGDLFGESLAMGDFNNDALADLVVGIPYDTDDKNYSVGAILVVPGRAGVAPLDLENSVWRSPESEGIKGVAHTFGADSPDSFGRTLATGDFNDDGFDDVAVGIPGVPLARTSGGTVYQDAGAVTILYGGALGIDSSDTLVTQETTGVLGGSEAGDLFGASLDAGQRTSSSVDLLAIGSTEERVVVLQGATGTGSVGFSQTGEIPGSLEVGDAFGAFVRFLDNLGNGAESLIVGAPGEDFSEGAVFILPSTGTLPTATGSTSLNEDSSNAGGLAESGDNWGWLGDSH